MARANIILTRIDNRLVHGQVGVTWANGIDIDTVVVVDDEAVQNPIGCKLMESVASAANKRICFYSVESFSNAFFGIDSNQKLFLVVSSPTTVVRLLEKQVPITVVNVGNMHYQRGKVAFNRKVYLSEQEIEAFNYLLDKNIDVYYQELPDTFISKIPYMNYEEMRKRR